MNLSSTWEGDFYGFYHGVRHREKTRTNNKEIQAASFKDLFFGMFTSFGEDSNRFWLCFIRLNTLTTLPEPNSSHLKVDGLEDSNCFWGPANFQVRAVSFREGRSTVWIANHGSQSQSRRFQNIIRFWIMDIGLLGSSCNWRWAPQTYIFRGFFNGKQPDFFGGQNLHFSMVLGAHGIYVYQNPVAWSTMVNLVRSCRRHF